MKQHRSALWLALLLLLPSAAPGGNSIQAAWQANNGSRPQESKQSPEQNKAAAEALEEAAQLSRTVVKLYNEGKYDKALPLAKRAVELRETALGTDDERVQTALLNLFEVYTAMRKYGEAQKLIERLLATREKQVGPEGARLAVILDKLAVLAYLQRDFDKSEAAYKRALAIREKAFGQENREVATSLFLLAEFYRFTGKYDHAQPLYEQAIVLRAKLLGYRDPEFLKAQERYSCLGHETLDANLRARLKEFTDRIREPYSASKIPPDVVLNGRAISLPRPEYPDEARRARAQGTVVIKVKIDELGKVFEAYDMCGGDPLLVGSSLEAARHARFSPTKLSGQPIKVSGVITYNFVPTR
jgi:TonB family protein